MTRIVSILLVLVSFSLVSAQEEGTTNPPQRERKTPPTAEEYHAMILAQVEELKKEQENAPKTLAEAHARLEQMLSAEELAKIDAMPSEDGMIQYHFSLGLNIRNGWGLWKGGPLAKHMQELGFTHPDIMSGLILDTFWCKRHGQDFRLEERAALYKKSVEAARKAEAEKQKGTEAAEAAIRNMMMGLRFEQRDVPVVRIPIKNGISARFLCPFRNGVFLSRCLPGSKQMSRYPAGYHDDPPHGEVRTMEPGEDFYTVGCFLDPTDRKIHWIRLPEVTNVYAAIVAGGRAWFAGLTNGKIVLVGIGDQDRVVVPLPQEDEIPDLGFDDQSLLAVYSRTIYRLTDHRWTPLHSGDILLPRSGLPPRLYGDTIFFRDEDDSPDSRCRRLWWLTMAEPLHLSGLDRDVGILRPGGPQWDEVTSYCVTSDGDLWACVGEHYLSNCLFRRSQDGDYSIAILGSSVRFLEEGWPNKRHAYQGASVSAIAPLPDGAFLLAGRTGLYRLKGDELVQELAFAFAPQDGNGETVPNYYNWEPNGVLPLDDRSYVISSSAWDGVYWLRRGDDGQWSCLALEEGDSVAW